MKRLASHVVRTIALFVATGITTLTLFVHAVDRERLGAPVATLPWIVAQGRDAEMSSAPFDRAQPAKALFANRQQ